MAFYTLTDKSYKLKDFDEKAWNGKGRMLPYIVTELYPPVREVLSRVEKEQTSWFYGKIVGEEERGTVQVIYPYTSEETDGILTPKNVNMQIYPYLTLKATPKEGYEFAYWSTDWNGLGIKLSSKYLLQIGPGDCEDVTTFFAHFIREDESYLGTREHRTLTEVL